MRKARELWHSLSLDEPENQARPDTLEQLLVMLARESARRLVHLVNYAGEGVSNLPRYQFLKQIMIWNCFVPNFFHLY